MSKLVTLQIKEQGKLVEIEENCRTSFINEGGTGNWQEVAVLAREKTKKGEVLTHEEELARELAWAYYSLAMIIHDDIFKMK